MNDMTKGEEVKRTQEKEMVKAWSIEEMRDKVNSLSEIDTEERIKWERFESGRDRSMLEEFGGKIEAEVLDSYKMEDSRSETFKGRGALLEWRRVRKNKKYRSGTWREDAWTRVFALFRECNLQRF